MPFSAAVRLTIGGLVGACAWLVVGLLLPRLPEPVAFLLGWCLFTLGPGFAVAGVVARRLDPLRRVIVLLCAGTAATPVLINVLGHLHAIPAFPYMAVGLVGAGVAWSPGSAASRTDRSDLIAAVFVAMVAAVIGAIVFWYRLSAGADGIRLYGDYDSADLSWYAGVASEASHTIPPQAFYYSGHHLNAAYFPHLVLAMVHRFCGVPVLSIYFRYAWPTFVTLTALAGFTLVRALDPFSLWRSSIDRQASGNPEGETPAAQIETARTGLASRAVAVLAVVLILIGSDFSYLAAWFLPHAAVDWDYLLWPTNFLSSTMQVMHFSTWSPSLPVYLAALYAIVRGLQTRERGWLMLSGFLIGILFEFKPFAWVVLMCGLAASAVFAGGDWAARRRFAATIALGVLFSLPFIWGAATLDPTDRRTRLVIQFFLLPKRMLIKIDLTKAFFDAASEVTAWPPLRNALFLLMATIVFLAIGIGVRWLGARGIWRAIREQGGGDAAGWRVLAWAVVAGIAVPFVLTTEPYVDTLQFYLAGLYLMWIFAAAALVAFARSHPKLGPLVVAAALALAFPSTGHYLARKLTDRDRDPRVGLTRAELAIADHLRSTTDPETTVVLHDRPLTPSLMTIVSERRIVLGWDVRYSAVGGEGRLREVNRFYSSASGNPDAALDVLRHYQVTHVIVRPQDDRVHPDVLARLKLILSFPDVVLYEVPPL